MPPTAVLAALRAAARGWPPKPLTPFAPGGLVAFAGAAALFLAACTDATVVRVIDGREVTGRFVSSRAYALYARGAESEARGDLESARVEYLAAASEDDDNAEIWTRIGAVTCALGRADNAKRSPGNDDDTQRLHARAEEAQRAFARAEEHAADYEPLYRERAACTLDLSLSLSGPSTAASALEDARAALALDPDNEDTVLLYARAAEMAGKPDLADTALRELVARLPGRTAGWRALHDLAARTGDRAAEKRSADALASLGVTSQGTPLPVPPAARPRPAAALDDVDAALARGALDEARTAAKRARLAPAELAVRAAALGRAAIAKTQADLVFSAEPSSASAAIALAVAADLLHDDPTLGRALAATSSLTTPPSPLARLLFAELVARRADREAAKAFLGPVLPLPEDADPLLRTVTARVAARLGP